MVLNLTKVRKMSEEKVKTDDTKECPYCHEEVKAAAIKCKHCSSDISTVDAAYLPEEKQAELSESKNKITAKCHSCGYFGEMGVVDIYHSDTAKYSMIFVVVCFIIYSGLFYVSLVATFVVGAILYSVWAVYRYAEATCPKCSAENHLKAGMQGFTLNPD